MLVPDRETLIPKTPRHGRTLPDETAGAPHRRTQASRQNRNACGEALPSKDRERPLSRGAFQNGVPMLPDRHRYQEAVFRRRVRENHTPPDPRRVFCRPQPAAATIASGRISVRQKCSVSSHDVKRRTHHHHSCQQQYDGQAGKDEIDRPRRLARKEDDSGSVDRMLGRQ